MSDAQQAELIRRITKATREADQQFEQSGGSSRHWVRECFIPSLSAEGLRVVDANLIEYAKHKGDCHVWNPQGSTCTCGLTELFPPFESLEHFGDAMRSVTGFEEVEEDDKV